MDSAGESGGGSVDMSDAFVSGSSVDSDSPTLVGASAYIIISVGN